MEKIKITIELDQEIVDKIKELLKKYNDSPMSTVKYADIESYLSYVITSQIKSADQMSDKIQESLKKLTEKLGDLDLGDFDLSKIFDSSKEEKKEKDEKPNKNVKN